MAPGKEVWEPGVLVALSTLLPGAPHQQTQLKDMCAVDTHMHIPHVHVHVYFYMHAYIYKQKTKSSPYTTNSNPTHTGPPSFCNGENPATVTFNWAPLCD